MKNNVLKYIGGGLLLSLVVYITYAYNKPQDSCVEELVDVICAKIDSGEVITNIGNLRDQHSFGIGYNIDSMDVTIGMDSLGKRLSLRLPTRFPDYQLRRGELRILGFSNFDGIELNLKNTLKIQRHLDWHKDRLDKLIKEQNIKRACELAKEINQ